MVIEFENETCSNTYVFGLDNSFKGSKYSFATDLSKVNSDYTNTIQKLGSAPIGSGHDNFLNGIVVQFDLTFSNKAWVEAERYHFLDFISSQSTMHCITKFDLDKSYVKYVNKDIITIIKNNVFLYNNFDEVWDDYVKNGYVVDGKVICPNKLYNGLTKEEFKNTLYLEILYSNPAGFKLTAKMTTNYRQLKTMYHQRKNHRLPEWHSFCEWVETLPMFKELILNEQ